MKRFYEMLAFVFTDACFTDSKRFAKLTSENAKVSIDNTEIQIVVTFFDNDNGKTVLEERKSWQLGFQRSVHLS